MEKTEEGKIPEEARTEEPVIEQAVQMGGSDGRPPVGQRYKAGGFSFQSPEEFAAAKKESDAVTYIRANSNLTDTKEIQKIYNKLVEKGSFQTPVGLTFLWELQMKLLRSGIPREEVDPVPVKRYRRTKKNKVSIASGAETELIRKELTEQYRTKFRNLLVVAAFLSVVVIALFVMTWQKRPVSDSQAREDILNEYSGWKQELELKEEELRSREEELGGTPSS